MEQDSDVLLREGVRIRPIESELAVFEEMIMSHLETTNGVGLNESFTPQPSEKRTLTDVEVAARLGVSRFTVRSWRLKGMGPRFLKMGRAVRYRPQDVDDYERQALVETQAGSDHSSM